MKWKATGVALFVSFSCSLTATPAFGAPSTPPVPGQSAASTAELEQMSQAVEAYSDSVFLSGMASQARSARTPGESLPAGLIDYVEQWEVEAASIREAGGVTVSDTTAEVLPVGGSEGEGVEYVLHVTRQVAELPEGQLWEEVIPLDISRDRQGALQARVQQQPSDDGTGRGKRADAAVTAPTPESSPDPDGAAALPEARAYAWSSAAAYATTWWNRRNPAYKTYSNDCTNFVSQAMVAAGWKQVYGNRTADSSWFANLLGIYSYSWGGAENFYRFSRVATTRGKYLSSVYGLPIGGVLQYKKTGSAVMNHTMLVTKRSTVNGKTMIYLTYHTTDTLNKPFSAMSGLSVAWFAWNPS